MSELRPAAKPSAAKKSTKRATPKKTATKPSKKGWAARVAFAHGHQRFALAPHQVLTTGGGAAVAIAATVFPGAKITVEELDGAVGFSQLKGIPNPLRLIAELERAGIVAQPNHIFFVHSGDCCCGPHPSWGWGGGGPMLGSPAYASPAYASPAYASPAYASAVGASPAYASPAYASPAYASPAYASPAYASPAYASPAYASPAYASPAYASPAYASPAYASPAYASGHRHSSARPAAEPYLTIAAARLAAASTAPKGASVVVLDTGLATTGFRPAAVTAMAALLSAGAPDGDRPDGDHDDELDPAAGHGTFIAGLIEQVAPGTKIALHRVLHAQGDGDEVTIAKAIYALPKPAAKGAILNLSFGGYVMDHPGVLASAVADAQHRGYVVVASAGNDGTCQPTFPAAFPDVISVGAVGPNGPASFTNYGSWVRACAPGVDLVSTFFDGWNGHLPKAAGLDPDDFEGWACWSGTSFSAPVVAGVLAREMTVTKCSASEAVTRLIDQPALLRIPGLGTVINAL